MAYALHAYKVDKGGKIAVEHIFYGETERECDEGLEAHADICPRFGPAVKENHVITFYEEIDAMPTPESVEEEFEADEEDEG